jgi:hypothetical protein
VMVVDVAVVVDVAPELQLDPGVVVAQAIL